MYTLPRWYAGSELLILLRDTLNSDPTDDLVSPATQNFEPGALITVGYQLTPDYRVEGSYFGSHEWNDTSLDNGDLITLRSTLKNGEINLRRRLDMPPAPYEASYLLGIRLMDIDDSITYMGATTQTTNSLAALQGGVLGQFYMDDRTWLDWETKGAVANNDVSATNLINDSATAYILETSVTANYQFLPSATLRLGYRGIWMAGLALSDENRDVLLLDDSGEMAYHGLNLGIMWTR